MKNLTITNQSETTREKRPKWSLTAGAFDKLLLALAGGGDRERGAEKYLLLRRNLVRFFEGRGFSEAEEAADEVCNRLARKLEAGETIENVDRYAYGLARFLALELYKQSARERRALNEMPKNEILPAQPGDQDEPEQRLGCLKQCLNDLSAESHELILIYYCGDGREKIKNRKWLAEKLGIPQTALRSRAVRLREKLKISLVRNLKKQTI